MDTEKARRIKAFTFDVDGVMTDGSLLADDKGGLFRTFNAKDGFSVRMASLNGYHLAIFTGGRDESIRHRFKTSGVPEDDIHLASRNKMKDFRDFCAKYSLTSDEVLYMGDDIPDICLLKECGLGIAPADAVPEVKEAADFISPFPGGKGCVRHAIETVMKLQGRWILDIDRYEKKF